MNIRTIGEYGKVLEAAGLLKNRVSETASERTVSRISCFSREVRPGTLFLCKGAAFRETYLSEAVLRGAVAYVSEREYAAGREIPCLLVRDIRGAMAVLAETFYEHPADFLRIIGVTGTKGKTTTAYYIRLIVDTWLAENGQRPSALLSSIENYDGVSRTRAQLTTPEPLELQKYLRTAVDAKVSYLTMEVSSQALKLQRIGHMKMETGVFLNISRDHISPLEHKNFEDYFQSKLQVFSHCRKVCVNLDAEHVQRVLDAASCAERVITFGTCQEAEIRGSGIRMEKGRLCFRLMMPGYEGEVCIPMHGIFNAENALAAAAACFSIDIPPQMIVKGLSTAKVSGRMEEYKSRDRKRTVLVDYAHNRLSFEKLFESVRMEYPGQPMFVIFGCPGGKAYNRRKDLAQVADRYADRIYLAPDDPGPENPREIAREIMSHFHRKRHACVYVDDRGEAVRMALEEAEPGTILLVLGKGCESTQRYADGVRPCLPDGELVQMALDEYDRKHDASA